jgi:hypothetical protein
MTSNSKMCKSGEFPTNHYALVRDQKFDDYGKKIDVLLLSWRPKALETGGEAVISVFDPTDAEFQRIKGRATNEKNSGCMFGPEFLVWVPKAKAFATFFMGTPSSRREAGVVQSIMEESRAATLASQKCSNKKFTWFAPSCSPCSTPFDMPTKQALDEAVEKFNNPPKNEIEGVTEETETRAR